MNATFDSAGHVSVPPIGPSKPTINEFNHVPEMIRAITMRNFGNQIFFASKLGESVPMVPSPDEHKDRTVSPLCRRTMLYIAAPGDKSLQTYIAALLNKDFDSLTHHVLIGSDR